MDLPLKLESDGFRTTGRVVGWLTLAGLIVFPLVVEGSFLVRLMTFTFIWVGVSSAWNLFTGYSGYFSFGHSTFFGIGAFTSTFLLLEYDVTPWIGMVVGAILAVVSSLILGAVLFRRRLTGLYFGLATLMVPLIIIPALVWQGFGEISVPYFPGREYYMAYTGPTGYYYIALILAIVATVVAWVVRRRRIGFYLRAINNSEDAARSLGVLTFQYKMAAFAGSAFLTALFGTVFVQATFVFTPEATFGLFVSVQPVVYSIVGGIGTVIGPVVAALLLAPSVQFLGAEFGGAFPGIDEVVLAVLLIVATFYFPDGLYTNTREWLMRTVEERTREEK